MNYCAAACWLLSASAAWAPAPATPAEALLKPATRIHLASQTLVLDSAGQVVPLAVWRPLPEKGRCQRLPAPGSSAQQPTYRVVDR